MEENAREITTIDDGFSVGQVVQQVRKVQELMKSVMRKDEHYGTIPGTQKPTLYKSGAEKLGFTFRLAPRYHGEREPIESENGHKEYIIRCELYHIVNGSFMGEGIGSCTTMESKYRYRWENTNVPVPKEYWNSRDPELLGGESYTARKTRVDKEQVWMIFHRVEHDNPADYFNTCLKMAKKRAHVDSILTALSVSDLFTQDLEDTAPETRETQSENKEESQGALPNCPKCGHNKSVIKGKKEWGGGYICWKKHKTTPGCGATWKSNGNESSQKTDDPPKENKFTGNKTAIFEETDTHKRLEKALYDHCDGDFIKMGDLLQGLTQWESGGKLRPGKKEIGAISEKMALVALEKFAKEFGITL